MKVLSVKQPWAYLICSGQKDVENRNWATSYRGRIMIHASKTIDVNANYQFDGLLGCIIGEVDIIDIVDNFISKWAEENKKHWILSNPVLYKKPIPCKGKIGLWEYFF